MRAAIFNGPKDITVGDRPDPAIQEPTDAVVRVVLACVCGSDLWYYRGESDHAVGSIGHEFIGIVEDVGAEVTGLARAIWSSRRSSSATCPARTAATARRSPAPRAGTSATARSTAARAKRSASRSPVRTLVPVPGSGHSDDTLKSLLTLSDVMATGHHAAVCAGVKEGDTVAVVGDGAVGLCAVLASKRLGAERIIALSRHPDRQRVARQFGATDIVEARGDEANEAVRELTGGIGVDAALECVGTQQSIDTAAAIARPGSTIGIVGVPHGEVPFNQTFFRNVGWRGGPAPARIYIPELLDDVLEGRIDPGLVLDYETDLDHIAEAYAAMDERRAIKSLIRVSSHEDLVRARAARVADARTATRIPTRRWVVAVVHDHVGRPRRRQPLRPLRRRSRPAVVPPRHRQRDRSHPAGGVERDVTFGQAASDVHQAIDAAYHAKYDRYGPRIVVSHVGPDAHRVTIQLVPEPGR